MAIMGTVTALSGAVVKAIAVDGTERQLQVGDEVALGEQIITEDASSVVIEFPNGAVLDLGSNTQVVLNENTINQGVGQVVDPEAEVEALQQAILEGKDPLELEATAAGTTAGEGDSIHNEVIINYEGGELNPEYGFNTEGTAPSLPQGQEELNIPPEEEPEDTLVAEASVEQAPVEEPPADEPPPEEPEPPVDELPPVEQEPPADEPPPEEYEPPVEEETPVNVAPLVQSPLNVFVADDASGQLVNLAPGSPDIDATYGYRVIAQVPVDADTAAGDLVVTVDASNVDDGQLWYNDASDGWTNIAGQNGLVLSVDELASLHYRPDADGSTTSGGLEDTDSFTYNVSDGVNTVAATVNLFQYTLDVTVTGKIGVETGQPLNSGSDNVTLVNFGSNPTQFQFQTDFGPMHGKNFVNETNFSEFEIILQVNIDGTEHYFRVQGEDAFNKANADGASFDENTQIWTSAVLTPDEFHEVTPSVANLKNATWSDVGDSTLKAYLDGDFDIDSTWTVRYNDEVQGNQQARFLSYEVEFETSPLPTSITGTGEDDLIYGTGGVDIVTGQGGSDTIVSGAGEDIIAGGDGKDIYVLTKEALAGNSADTITDFQLADNGSGDVLDVNDVLDGLGLPHTAETVTTRLSADTVDGNTVISVDVDGTGTKVPLVTLQGVAADLGTLLNNEQIDYTPSS